jgi:hypothetical protein
VGGVEPGSKAVYEKRHKKHNAGEAYEHLAHRIYGSDGISGGIFLQNAPPDKLAENVAGQQYQFVSQLYVYGIAG